MSKLVDRFRAGGPCEDGKDLTVCKVRDAASGCICAEAADTIEDLELRRPKGWEWFKEVVFKAHEATFLKSEIGRLEAEVARHTQKGLAYLVAIQHLTAENERLRAALIHARNQMQHPDQLIDEALTQEPQR